MEYPVSLILGPTLGMAAGPGQLPANDLARLFRLGEKIELKGQTFYVVKKTGDN